jgi:hypothetical protein
VVESLRRVQAIPISSILLIRGSAADGRVAGALEIEMNIELENLKRRLYIDSRVKNVKFFPGSDREASPEDFAREMNKFFADAENGDHSLDIEAELDAA